MSSLGGIGGTALRLMRGRGFDCLALGVADFAEGRHEGFEVSGGRLSEAPRLWFDLASLSKPLYLGAARLRFPELFDGDMDLLLEHRGGFPPWGLLSDGDYRELLLSRPVRESETRYSDLSAIRLMLEIEKKSGRPLKEMVSDLWDEELRDWRDLPGDAVCPPTGFRGGRPVRGEVQDLNALNISAATPHAGLFATVGGLCRTLLAMDRELSLLERVGGEVARRGVGGGFVWGWDRPQGEATLAGAGHGPLAFGHLGFTGTMMWVDPDRRRGFALLANATRSHWHDRGGLNEMRRKLGRTVWALS